MMKVHFFQCDFLFPVDFMLINFFLARGCQMKIKKNSWVF